MTNVSVVNDLICFTMPELNLLALILRITGSGAKNTVINKCCLSSTQFNKRSVSLNILFLY